MNELHDEVKLTIELMQGDIDDVAHNELQHHLMILLEIKRELLGAFANIDMADNINPFIRIGWPYLILICQNGNDGEHYRDTLIGKRAGGGIIIGFEGDDAIIMCTTAFGSMRWDDAVQFCEAFRLDKHKDWRLPTKNQLNLAWVNREKLGDLNLDDYWYWSSTQYSKSFACQSFGDGDQCYYGKNCSGRRVRPVRSVKIESLEIEGSYIMGDV